MGNSLEKRDRVAIKKRAHAQVSRAQGSAAVGSSYLKAHTGSGKAVIVAVAIAGATAITGIVMWGSNSAEKTVSPPPTAVGSGSGSASPISIKPIETKSTPAATEQAAEQDRKRAEATKLAEAKKVEERATNAACAKHAEQWCRAEQARLGSMKITYDTQYGEVYGEDYAGQSHSELNFSYSGCTNRLTKFCQRGRARFKLKRGADPQFMSSWCVDVDNLDQWQCH